jgi:O-acetyl-ADP-ribose deacetylase (regulator of RNase III)
MLTHVKGDILESPYNIAHGVNCQNAMGSGVAKAIYTKYPVVKESYRRLCENQSPESLLGKVQCVYSASMNKSIFNLFTQLHYGRDGKPYASLIAIKECFSYLNTLLLYDNYLAIPKIGCGLGGLRWEDVEPVIDASAPYLNIYVYSLD